ncbi:hypothetical protein [Ruegeria lacuscaerulensis]|uniref:hypothetical protein n=1 Tax=Ruegeria lacuscaerulensis TaxID=55218 RepID=UPI00147F2D49|nr:hypothetical protein [Ruegeria lacuscaerulensis]
MKIDASSHFPHPVLCDGNGDFRNGEFEIEIQVHETIGAEIELEYEIKLTEKDLNSLREQGIVKAGAFIRCRDTFYSELKEAENLKGTWHLDNSLLFGEVEIKPLIWLEKDLRDWSSSGFNEEFGETISVARSEVIGIGADASFNIGKDKLKRFESIFELVEAQDVEKGTVKIDLSTDAIQIRVAPELFRTVHQMRNRKMFEPVLLNGIYLPVIMEVLDNLNDSSSFEDKSWHRVFIAKCQHLGINTEDPVLLENAQKLLASPIGKLEQSFEEMNRHA